MTTLLAKFIHFLLQVKFNNKYFHYDYIENAAIFLFTVVSHSSDILDDILAL